MKIIKIKSSALYYTLFLSVIFGISLTALLQLFSSNQKLLAITNLDNDLMQNARSGIEFGLAYPSEIGYGEPNGISLFGKGTDSVELSKEKWGLLTILKSRAFHGDKSFQLIGLLGNKLDTDLPELYLADKGRELTVCGDTRIEGECHLPKFGIKRGYIEGQNYRGSKMVYGKVQNSGKTLPELNIKNELQFDGTLLLYEKQLDSLTVSFAEKTQIIISDNFLVLDNVNYKGKIIISTKDSIVIGKNCQLENVIISSPVVTIKSGFQGAIQIFAGNKITVEEGALLCYPSVLWLNEKTYPDEKSAEIFIGLNSQVIGTIMLTSEKPNFRKPVQLHISDKAEVNGLVFCKGRTQLKGKIQGHLYTEKFYLKTRSSSYENHVLNGQILAGLPEGFTVANIFDQSESLNMIAWLN